MARGDGRAQCAAWAPWLDVFVSIFTAIKTENAACCSQHQNSIVSKCSRVFLSPPLVRSPSAFTAVRFPTSGIGARSEIFRRSPCRLRRRLAAVPRLGRRKATGPVASLPTSRRARRAGPRRGVHARATHGASGKSSSSGSCAKEAVPATGRS